MNLTNISNTMQVLQSWYQKTTKLGQVVGDNSLSDLTKQTKVEPLVILSKETIGIEAMPDVMQGLLNYGIADYVQAVALFGAIDNIEVRRALGAFNPSRDGSAGALMATANFESYGSKAMQFSLPTGNIPVMEAKDDGKDKRFSGKELQDEAKNMSVGKMIDVKFTPADCNPVVLPIQFRLLASYISSDSMMNLLSNGVDDTGFFARFERAQDGGISKFMDFFLAQDMVEEKRKLLYSDDGKVLQKIMARASANKRAALATRTPSLASLSNIFVITDSEAKNLEARMGRKLSSEAGREELVRNVCASTLVVVSAQWNQVTFWHRGYDTALELDFKQLKASNGSRGPDLMDMFRQFNMGMPIA